MDKAHDEALLKSDLSVLGRNLSVLSLANALDTLARHAAAMDHHDELNHAACVECETMVLLGRVVRFGDQLREQK